MDGDPLNLHEALRRPVRDLGPSRDGSDALWMKSAGVFRGEALQVPARRREDDLNSTALRAGHEEEREPPQP